MENKWLMFKNYMHNELGITKEDIRQWIEDAVKSQAEALIKNEHNNFDVSNTIKKIIFADEYFGSKRLKEEVSHELAKQLLSKINFKS